MIPLIPGRTLYYATYCAVRHEMALAQDYARQGKLLIVAPDDTCGVRTLSRDRDALLRLYEKGLRDGQKIPAFLRP